MKTCPGLWVRASAVANSQSGMENWPSWVFFYFLSPIPNKVSLGYALHWHCQALLLGLRLWPSQALGGLGNVVSPALQTDDIFQWCRETYISQCSVWLETIAVYWTSERGEKYLFSLLYPIKNTRRVLLNQTKSPLSSASHFPQLPARCFWNPTSRKLSGWLDGKEWVGLEVWGQATANDAWIVSPAWL